MNLLRLTQTTVGPDQYQIQVELTGPDIPRQTVTAPLSFALTEQDRGDLRWYLEDFLQIPFEPERQIAARIEARMVEIGVALFEAVFQADDDARDLWATLRDRLNDTRVEVVTGVQEAASIPWELLRDPKTDTPLALRAQAFVRAQPQAAQRPTLPRPARAGEAIRVLLVICRPGAGKDVPFRSVASRLIKGLTEEARSTFELHVLRPPTFAALGEELRRAKAAGRPYHVVHFDGHGLYAEVKERRSVQELLKGLMPLLLAGPETGAHGYLVFENPALEDNAELVKGDELGRLLVETDVPVLVLNACRSAHADPTPVSPPGTDLTLVSPPLAGEGPGERSLHDQIRAYGSLAQEVMDQGVAGVVAMRYNVYVVTAAQFVADLYAALVRGQTLGEAVTLGRKQLHDQPLRAIAYDPIPLQDWPVPVAYEAAPIQLFPPRRGDPSVVALRGSPLRIAAGEAATGRGALDPGLPPPPDVGFFGRDETLLALDRAFDTEHVVLLHAFAGSGKTATAAEFARWYAGTGGVDGPVLFTSFELYKPLPHVLDQLGALFEEELERAGVQWLALDDRARRDVVLKVLQQAPVLWIWDNVEPVGGFPAGTPSAWRDEEQRELASFLRSAQGTRAKFLLTSRRDERGWLGDDWPRRIAIPPMPMQERVQLARAIAERHGKRLAGVDDWRPLLRYSEGNPLTLTVVVGQALRDGLTSREQIEEYVRKLRAGEAQIEDDASQGRTRSLGASLSYGFTAAFSEEERCILALLHLFQGFVDVDALVWMGNPGVEYSLAEVRGLTRESGIRLLDRAAGIGLLTAHGGGHFSIHPALPWYFKSLFDECYAGAQGTPQGAGARVEPTTRAYVEAMGELGNYYHDQYGDGNRDVIPALRVEEANLLHARALARRHGWWPRVISAMQGLRTLYDHTGRRAEWARLMGEIEPDFVDPATGGPLPGREEQWGLVTEYRVQLAREARDWPEAGRLQRAQVEWTRQRAAPALAVLDRVVPAVGRDDAQRNAIRTLAVSLEQLGHIQREQSEPGCVSAYLEAVALYQRIADRTAEAVAAFNLGHAYKNLPTLRDPDQAERWYRRSLELCAEGDRLGRGKCTYGLGHVAYDRFRDARKAEPPRGRAAAQPERRRGLLRPGAGPAAPDAVDDLAVAHNQLGAVYRGAGDLDRAVHHYRESIRYEEMQGNVYGAAQTRFNVALALMDAGRLPDAREYALAALRNYQTYGDRAAADIQETQRLIARIEQAMGR